jgi:hypothetical protein
MGKGAVVSAEGENNGSETPPSIDNGERRTHLFNSGYIEEQQLLCDKVSYILLPR